MNRNTEVEPQRVCTMGAPQKRPFYRTKYDALAVDSFVSDVRSYERASALRLRYNNEVPPRCPSVRIPCRERSGRHVRRRRPFTNHSSTTPRHECTHRNLSPCRHLRSGQRGHRASRSQIAYRLSSPHQPPSCHTTHARSSPPTSVVRSATLRKKRSLESLSRVLSTVQLTDRVVEPMSLSTTIPTTSRTAGSRCPCSQTYTIL